MGFHGDYDSGVSGIISRRAKRVEITDLEANAARLGARSSGAPRPCANGNRKSHSCLVRPRRIVGQGVAIREARIASRTAGVAFSRAVLRIARHVQHPVQKQGRPVPNQRRGQADRLRDTKFPTGKSVEFGLLDRLSFTVKA